MPGALRPVPDLSLRREPVGGKPRASMAVAPEARARLGRTRLVVLVHGFNVTQDEALKSYKTFRHNLGRGLRGVDDFLLTFAWPGDARWYGGREAAYYRMVGHAMQCAEIMGDFLMTECGAAGRPEVFLVGHSLGCRLILEAIERGFNHPNPTRRPKFRVYLMAAAVPIGVASEGRNLRHSIARINQKKVFHSIDDWILRFTFRPGQWMARRAGYDPRAVREAEAVGLRGRPETGVWSTRLQRAGAGHSDYWPSKAIAHDLARELGGVPPRDLEAHVPPHNRLRARRMEKVRHRRRTL